MFHKFSANPAKGRTQQKGVAAAKGRAAAAAAAAASTSDDTATSLEQPPASRQKTTRACDRCRLHRTKCGDKKPCEQCVSINAKCVVSYAPPRSSSLSNPNEPEAPKGQVPRWTFPASATEPSNNSVSGSIAPTTSPASLSASSSTVHLERPWTAQSASDTISSDISSSLTSNIQGFFASGQPAFSRATAVTGCLFPQLPHPAMPSGDLAVAWTPLLNSQRNYYLRLFWEVCHPLFPIMSEAEFAELEALTSPALFEEYSAKSALVDAMIALGIQCSHATGLANRVLGLQVQPPAPYDGSSPSMEGTWPGFEYFHRCREGMRVSTEGTLEVLRSHTLMALYLIKGNAFRDAYNLLGITVRKAYIAKLHRQPPSHLSSTEKTARMQLWWTLFAIDLQCSMQLDIPAAVQKNLVKCPVPSEEILAACGSPGRGDKYISVSTYSNCLIQLAVILNDISSCVSTADIVDDNANSPSSLEHHAHTLLSALQQLEAWHDQLPPDLSLARPADSVGNAEIPDFELEAGFPTWLERQRILLELHYHNAYILIQRPFIRLRHATSGDGSGITTPPDPQQSNIELHIASALHHAMVTVTCIHNVCSRTDILYGWSEILQPLWNATMTIMAYIYANSLNSIVSRALSCLSRAQAVFDSFSATCATASSAKDSVRFLNNILQNMTSSDPGSMSRNDSMGWDLFAALLEEQRTPGSSLFNSGSSSDPFGSILFSPSELSMPDFGQMTG